MEKTVFISGDIANAAIFLSSTKPDTSPLARNQSFGVGSREDRAGLRLVFLA